MGVFGITRSEMDRAIERECSSKAKELEATVKSIGNRVDKLEADAKHISEHETKIDKLEQQFKELDRKIEDRFNTVEKKFDNLDVKFTEVINTTRQHVDDQVKLAITQLNDADKRWEGTNTKLQEGMDDLNEKMHSVEGTNTKLQAGMDRLNENMTELVTTVKGLTDRTTNLELAPAKQALEEKNAAKKALATKAFDILFKLFVAGMAALLAAKGINLF